VKKQAAIQIRAIPAKINLSSTKKSIASAIPRTKRNRQYQCPRGARLTARRMASGTSVDPTCRNLDDPGGSAGFRGAQRRERIRANRYTTARTTTKKRIGWTTTPSTMAMTVITRAMSTSPSIECPFAGTSESPSSCQLLGVYPTAGTGNSITVIRAGHPRELSAPRLLRHRRLRVHQAGWAQVPEAQSEWVHPGSS